jgi:hypothetical protein
VCQECDELRLGVPGLCLGEAGVGAGKRCKWLIIKPLEPAVADYPRVGSSILSLATINFLIFQQLAKEVCRGGSGELAVQPPVADTSANQDVCAAMLGNS